jgi:ABC-type uncharacterized transport system substrate-binding protein
MQLKIQLSVVCTVLLCLIMVSSLAAQTPAGYAQQFFVMTKLVPSLKFIGVISSKATDQMIQGTNRAGLPYGVKVFIAKAGTPRDIPGLYQSLIKKEVQLIWIPDKDDEMVMEKGFEYLREMTLENKIGLCVPDTKMITEGALCSIQLEGNKVVAYINKRVAQVTGATIPNDPSGSVKYIIK